jgi:MerR HTH family regulatory protein
LFTTDEAARLSGCSYRQIDYWTRVGAITPSQEASGSGSRRAWDNEQVERLCMIATLARLLGGAVQHDLVAAVWDAPLDDDAIAFVRDEHGHVVIIDTEDDRPVIRVPRCTLALLAQADATVRVEWERMRVG